MEVFRVRYVLAAKLVNELVEAADKNVSTRPSPATATSTCYASTYAETATMPNRLPRSGEWRRDGIGIVLYMGTALIGGEHTLPARGVTMMGTPRRKAGALAGQVEGYREWLAQRGYTPQTVRNMLKDLGLVGQWLSRVGLQVVDLSENRLTAFLVDQRRAGRRRLAGKRGWSPLLTFLRERNEVPEAQVAAGPLDDLLTRYRHWMDRERGLSAATMLRYENTARRFLSDHAMAGGQVAPEQLSGADLNAFLLRECGRVSSGSAKGRVAELRSLMRFLHLNGLGKAARS